MSEQTIELTKVGEEAKAEKDKQEGINRVSGSCQKRRNITMISVKILDRNRQKPNSQRSKKDGMEYNNVIL